MMPILSARIFSVLALGVGVAWSGALMSTQTTPAPHVVKVVGEQHKLVLLLDGNLVGWGLLDAGQLGPPVAIPSARRRSTEPVSISMPGQAVDVAAAEATSYALLPSPEAMASRAQ